MEQESGRGHSGLVHAWMGLDRIGLAALDRIGVDWVGLD